MDLAKLKALIDLVAGSRVHELEIVEGEERIRITKAASPADDRSRTSDRPPARLEPGRAVEQPVPPADGARESDQCEHPTSQQGSLVRAPMFGVFHRTPSPDAAPFVELGQQVEEGQTLCLIEAMKAFNAVTADRAGSIAAVLADGGQEVEQGQPLFRIA
jgi:acetyl-CoA carboxylase biotin carboxyl carrier protein